MYKGLISPETLLAETQKKEGSAATHSVVYGIGNWYLYNGRSSDGISLFRNMLRGDQWTSFGYMAAEADLKQLN
jgi:hypothetical protein